MVDQETTDVSAGPAGAPVNRDARREPEVIEGEIAARETDGSEPPPDPPAPESSAEPSLAPAAAPRTGVRSLLAGAVAGLIVSVLGLGAGYTLLASKGDVSETANRLSAIEAQARQENDAIAAEASHESAAVAGLEKRVSALETGASNAADLDKRVAALEAASAGNGAASEATQRLAAQEKDLRADIDAERGAIPDLSARVAKLETEMPKTNGAGPDLAALAGRVRQDRGCARHAQERNARRRREARGR